MMPRPLWHREGLLVSVKANHPWWVSHAQLPTALPLTDRLWRVYFGARDCDNRARVLAIDLDPSANMRIVAEHFNPLLDRGSLGAFDHEGVTPSAAVNIDGQIRLYYIGVSVRKDVRSQTSIGLAVSDDGLTFRRPFAGPAYGTGPFDPYFNSAPAVRKTVQGFRMWYVGGAAWREVNGELEPFYEIRTTHSADGMIWSAHSQTAVGLEPPSVAGLGRPWNIEEAQEERLYFSRRGENYRTAGDGAYRLMSVRVNDQGVAVGDAEPVEFDNPPAPGDFDGWMQAYACIAPYGGDLIMFYNGDDFGRAGFGWARLPRGGIMP